jgi:16S rRNA (guanine(966)-N(2))-methyltransferase RsmD
MRVIAGSARGLRLKAPEGRGTRPMTDRVKESLFGTLASLGYPQEGDRVLDLYAGTGSLGIEALSRGAGWCDFVEQNAGVGRIIAANLAFTRLAGRARVHSMAVDAYLKLRAAGRSLLPGDKDPLPAVKCDIIFMDPPYADPAIREILGQVTAGPFLAPDGLLVVGHATTVELPDAPGPLRRIRHRTFGGSAFSLYKYAAAAAGSEADPGDADAAPDEDDDEEIC